MARIARVIAPGFPHHVTQRGNRRQTTFFHAEDYAFYLGLLRQLSGPMGCKVLAYCLMPNHVHLILIPDTTSALARTMGEVHRSYTRYVNHRRDWRGYLWQGRFFSCPIERENALIRCVAYVLRNPVRAGLVQRAGDWKYSNAKTLFEKRHDPIADHMDLLDLLSDWQASVSSHPADEESIRTATQTGRPFGSIPFIEDLERLLKRRLAPQRRGPKTTKHGQ
jgi:putative transposase